MTSAKELFRQHKVATIGSIGAILLLCWLGWYFSARQVIKRQLTAMAWDIGREAQESTMETALKMRDVKAVLASTCEILVPGKHRKETVERDMGIMYLMHYRDQYQLLTPQFQDIAIDFPADTEAEVKATVLLQRQKQQGQVTEVTAPVQLVLKKTDGDWLLTQAEIAAALLDD
jgi:hypothetical protein